MTERRRATLAVCAAALALSASRAGRPPFGPAALVARAQQSAPTFTKDVAPIVFAACAPCHRPDGGAPFPLLTYRQVKSHAAAIGRVTRERIMPPWKPEPGYGRFADERRLSDAQIATIRAWVEAGAAEGDPKLLPAVPTSSGRWTLGPPDLILQTPAYTLRSGNDDVYRTFVLPIAATEGRYVKAWQFLPGNSHVVHHATMQFDPTGASRQLDAQDPEPGYEGLIPHSVGSPDGFFLGWLPGHSPYIAPEGMAWPLPRNSDLVMMLHLRPTERDEQVQASLGIYFSGGPPRLHPLLIRLTRQHMDIPPGERHYVVRDSFPLDADVDVYTVQPHAHYLAKEVKAFATLPDGTRKWLIYIRDWDFDWQGVFRYARPEFLPAGATIGMEYSYDNSAENPRNPHHPPRRMTYGQRTTEEMAELWLQVVPRHDADRPRLARTVRNKIVREDIVGLEKRLEADRNNAALHDDVALLYAEAGRLDRTAAHFAETLRIKPDSPAAHYNLGNVLFRQNRVAEAVDLFRRALDLKYDYAPAYDGLGVATYTAGKISEAIQYYQKATDLDPANPDAHQHLGVALRSAGRLAEAVAQYRQVLQIDPGRNFVKEELATIEQQLAREKVERR